jgi:hypothetical protein
MQTSSGATEMDRCTTTLAACAFGIGIVFGILGGQAALTAKTAEALGEDAAEAFGESIPIVGVAVSAGALLYDGYQTYKAYSGCLAGAHE